MFIVQRCGKEVIDGAEYFCIVLAEKLSKHLDVGICFGISSD